MNRSDSGQGLVEYVLILAGIALACIGATMFLSGGLNGLYSSVASSPVLTPPSVSAHITAPAVPLEPTSAESCLDGDWRDYPQFEDEAACLRFVEQRG